MCTADRQIPRDSDTYTQTHTTTDLHRYADTQVYGCTDK